MAEEQGSFTWNILNYNAYPVGEVIVSEYYETKSMMWKFMLQKGSRLKNVLNNSVSYTMIGNRENTEPIRVKIRVQMISAVASIPPSLLSEKNFFTEGLLLSFQAVLTSRSFLLEYSVNKVLTLRFDVEFSKIEKCITSNHLIDCGFNSEIHKSSTETLLSDIRSYLSKQDSGDVVLSVEQQEFRVHKIILSARSPVFQRMFESDMKENLTNTVSIPDVSVPVLRQMIKYMYGEEVDEASSDTCIGLYAAAEKYCMHDLKVRCARLLEKNLSPDIACEVASMAHLHRDIQLLASATSYISSHAAQVICSKGWVELLTKVPVLTSDLAVAATNRDNQDI